MIILFKDITSSNRPNKDQHFFCNKVFYFISNNIVNRNSLLKKTENLLFRKNLNKK